ncbi:monooxygenase [Iamia sp. SCSIO 61187]|uniref:DUF5990 family protein n=1 Tax=Iamia sp. SCSIO 61187 TaxID=2722752 RepID=UPI001C635BDF|nr:DUF5990 family protein [Iamia sp. SCSIO 61187]QYG90997.1 monooxygenase [Iamia sp. SCSIO 61187]
MRITIIGVNAPGREFCRPDGSVMTNVHVGVQLGQEPTNLVCADTDPATWKLDVDVADRDGDADFRGPAVQGRRGDRFVYLTWGELGSSGDFEMFRRAKLMLNRIDVTIVERARKAEHLVARVDLTGGDGGPRCARVDPPAIAWSVQPS